MTTAGPWSVKGIDPKARELAKDLARRSGMTLGEWLNQMITDDADDEPEPAPRPVSRELRLSSDAELKRVARALDALTARVEASEHRSTLAISGIDQSVMGVLSRVEGVERDKTAIAARFSGDLEEVKAAQAKVTERVRRASEEDAPRLEAMRALEGAIGKIAEKLYDTETKTRAILNEVRDDVSNVSRRMDRVETRVEAEPAATLVDGVVSRIAERLADAEARTSSAMKALETSFAGLDARLKASEAAQSEDSPERRFERLASELSTKVEANRAEITERLSAAADGKLDRMEATLRDLTGHVEQGERRSAQAIDRMGREVMRIAQTLNDRVATVEARSAETSQQIGGEMARIADAMEQRMGRADQLQSEALEKLGGEIARIAERLADRIASAERRSAVAIDDVGEQMERITGRLNDRNEASQNALAERIQASEDRTAKLLDEARDAIDRRLLETQRRATLEVAAVEAAQTVEAPPVATVHTPAEAPFEDDPFAPLIASSPATELFAPPPPRGGFSGRDFDSASPFAPLDDRYAGFAADGVEAEHFAPPPPPAVDEPRSTRDVVAAARAAARQAGERAEPVRGRRDAQARGDGADLAGSVIAPPLEEAKSGFSFGLPKRRKKEPAVTLRTMVVASGTAAALAVTAAGASLYILSETPGGQHVDRSAPPPTAARADDKPVVAQVADAPGAVTGDAAPAPSAPPETLAVALAPLPGATAGVRPPAPLPSKAKAPTAADVSTQADARPLYNTALGRLQAGDPSGVEDLRKAANLGFGPAQFYLAKLYEQGGSGVKKDLGEARRWTERAAVSGDPRAMHNLALYEFNGEGGAKDQVDAARWFKKAAEQGVVDSQYNLGRLYQNGMRDGASGAESVPQNRAEAYKWYLIAAAQGDKGAKASADALKAEIPADQAAAAERTAQAFRPHPTATVDTAAAH